MSMPHTCQCRICQREMTNFTALNTVNALAAELVTARARIAYLEGALRVIVDGTICPDLFPNDTDENVIAAKTAMVTAIAALEHSESETAVKPVTRMCPECKAVGGPDGVTNCETCRGDFWDSTSTSASEQSK